MNNNLRPYLTTATNAPNNTFSISERNKMFIRNIQHLINFKDAIVEHSICTRDKNGFMTLELQVILPNSNFERKYIVYKDMINTISEQYITINRFSSLHERNLEIKRLYLNENMSQMFLANIFGLTQGSISQIVNRLF